MANIDELTTEAEEAPAESGAAADASPPADGERQGVTPLESDAPFGGERRAEG